jgi:hypothetical protein
MRTLVALIVLWVAPAAVAQRVSGSVRATGTLAPMADVTMTVLDSVGAAVAQGRTGNDGRYSIGIERDARQIRATRIGYRPVVLNIPAARGEAIVDVVMDVFRELDTVLTKAPETRFNAPRLQDFEKRRLSGMGGQFVSDSILRKMEDVSMPSILRARIPGFRIVEYHGQLYGASGSTATMRVLPRLDERDIRSPRGCWVSIFIDGIVMFDGVQINGEIPPNLSGFMAMNLSGVEYYPHASSTPLQFKSLRNNCGSLLFWTRGR